MPPYVLYQILLCTDQVLDEERRGAPVFHTLSFNYSRAVGDSIISPLVNPLPRLKTPTFSGLMFHCLILGTFQCLFQFRLL